MWESDSEESWVLKNWCFWTVVLEKTCESPLDCKEIKPVNPKANQSWIFIGRLILKLKLQYFGHLMWRTDSLKITLMLGKIEDRRRRGRQDEMVGWLHWLDVHEFEQALGVGDRQGSLVCYSPWDRKELDTTEQLKWTDWLENLLSPWVKWSACLSHTRAHFSSAQFSRSVMTDSLRPHESQHARPPCPSLTPGVHSDSHASIVT